MPWYTYLAQGMIRSAWQAYQWEWKRTAQYIRQFGLVQTSVPYFYYYGGNWQQARVKVPLRALGDADYLARWMWNTKGVKWSNKSGKWGWTREQRW